MPPEKTSGNKFGFYKFWGLAFQLVISSLVLGWLGYQLDKWIGWEFPLFLLLGIILGLVSSVIRLIRSLNEKDKEEQNKEE